jgi:hypothetical protein
MAKYKLLSRNLPGGTGENHKTSQSRYSVSRPGFEPGSSRIVTLSQLPRSHSEDRQKPHNTLYRPSGPVALCSLTKLHLSWCRQFRSADLSTQRDTQLHLQSEITEALHNYIYVTRNFVIYTGHQYPFIKIAKYTVGWTCS